MPLTMNNILKELDPFTKPLVYKVLFQTNLMSYKLSTVTLELSRDTNIEIGMESMWKEADLIRDSEEIASSLTGRCKGLALNLVPSDSLIYMDKEVKSRNLILNDPLVTRKNGSLTGCIRNNISVSVTVHRPDAEKLKALLNEDLPYDITSVTFGLYIGDQLACDVWDEWLEKIRGNFTVIYCDAREGIVLMVARDIYLSAKYDEENNHISMKISTKYPFQMKGTLIEKDMSDLIDYIIYYGSEEADE